MILRILRYSWIPTMIALIIFYLCCLIPMDDIPSGPIDFGGIPLDKIVHFCMYFGLSGASALYYVYDNKGYIHVPKMIIGAFILPILYGGIIEIAQQQYFPQRTGDWSDFFANMIGSLASLPFVFIVRSRLLKKNRQ